MGMVVPNIPNDALNLSSLVATFENLTEVAGRVVLLKLQNVVES